MENFCVFGQREQLQIGCVIARACCWHSRAAAGREWGKHISRRHLHFLAGDWRRRPSRPTFRIPAGPLNLLQFTCDWHVYKGRTHTERETDSHTHTARVSHTHTGTYLHTNEHSHASLLPFLWACLFLTSITSEAPNWYPSFPFAIPFQYFPFPVSINLWYLHCPSILNILSAFQVL